MIVATVTPLLRPPDEAVPDAAVHLAEAMSRGLTGRMPDRQIVAKRSSLGAGLPSCDLIIVTTMVHDGAVAADLLSLLEGVDLVGPLVFLGTIGPWPAEAATGDRLIRPLLIRSGARCPAPTLHVSDVPTPILAAYCRFWARPLPSLLGSRTAEAIPA